MQNESSLLKQPKVQVWRAQQKNQLIKSKKQPINTCTQDTTQQKESIECIIN